MATDEQREREAEWRARACAETRAWIDSLGRGGRARVARRIRMSPSRVGRCVNPERDEAGSPAFVRALAVAYPERWTALYREYRSIVEPTHMTQAGSDDRALRQAEILAEIARIEDVMVRELRHLLKKARALINMQ